jgi:hypothetical protein
MLIATLCVLFIGCASSKPAAEPERVGPPPEAPRVHSSIQAVLAAREELQLTDEQVDKMKEIDGRREAADTALKLPKAGPSTGEKKEAKDADHGSPQDAGMGTMGGPGGMMGGRGGHAGRGMRGASAASPSEPKQKGASIQERLDDNDTASYLEAEESLTEVQKTRAREIASKYREQLSDYREYVARNRN